MSATRRDSQSSSSPPVSIDLEHDFNESSASRKRQRLSATSSASSSFSFGTSTNGLSQTESPGKSAYENGTSSPLDFAPTSISRVVASRATAQQDSTTKSAPLPPTIAAARDPSALKSLTSFATLEVAPWLVVSLGALSVKRPTEIQARCIPPILRGSDCIGGSRTGSGKTIAFVVPILQRLFENPSGIFAVVLTPTRELALQIYEQFSALGAPQGLKCALVIGGGDLLTQARALSERPHIVIATPGRLADHIRTSGSDTVVGLRRTKFMVLDEADRLLAPGRGSMVEDVEEIMGAIPSWERRQTLLFTATVTKEVKAARDDAIKGERKARDMFVAGIDELEKMQPMGQAQSNISNGNAEAEDQTPRISRQLPLTLKQTYLFTPPTHREAYLHILLSTAENEARSTIIFANRAATVQLLEHTLRLLEHRVTSLHSILPQRERANNLGRFRARVARILVATDVASRGLDIPDVALVVNFDIPKDPDDYVHRVGRTARAGNPGVSVTLVGQQRDAERVMAIEGRVEQKMEEYAEEGVNIESRVVRDGMKIVGEKKREAMLQVEQGMNVKGTRKRQKLKPAE